MKIQVIEQFFKKLKSQKKKLTYETLKNLIELKDSKIIDSLESKLLVESEKKIWEKFRKFLENIIQKFLSNLKKNKN